MKVLVLSCTMGQGHNSAGLAVHEALRIRGVESEFADALAFASPRVSKNIARAYHSVAVNTPSLFNAIYHLGKLVSSPRRKSPIYYLNSLYKDKMSDYIVKNGYDTVIMPHIFPAQTLTNLRREGSLAVRTIGIATDYTCIPFWEETDLDALIIPHSDLEDEFVACGVSRDILRPLGIPVRPGFNESIGMPEARRRLGIAEGAPAILIMTGSMGYGNIVDTMRAIRGRFGEDVSIVALTGNNRKLREGLIRAASGQIRTHIVEYTDRVSEYMDACDVVMTKPGGLSSTEAAVKNKPLILTRQIPGCETRNAEFFKTRGLAMTARSAEEEVRALEALLSDGEAREAMLAAQRKHMRPDTAGRICDMVTGGDAGGD